MEGEFAQLTLTWLPKPGTAKPAPMVTRARRKVVDKKVVRKEESFSGEYFISPEKYDNNSIDTITDPSKSLLNDTPGSYCSTDPLQGGPLCNESSLHASLDDTGDHLATGGQCLQTAGGALASSLNAHEDLHERTVSVSDMDTDPKTKCPERIDNKKLTQGLMNLFQRLENNLDDKTLVKASLKIWVY
jgi:hypothetical protein